VCGILNEKITRVAQRYSVGQCNRLFSERERERELSVSRLCTESGGSLTKGGEEETRRAKKKEYVCV
jgi:hypothetical protein